MWNKKLLIRNESGLWSVRDGDSQSLRSSQAAVDEVNQMTIGRQSNEEQTTIKYTVNT